MAFQAGEPQEQWHGNRTGRRPWNIQLGELLGAEKGTVGKEASTRVRKTLKNQRETPRLYEKIGSSSRPLSKGAIPSDQGLEHSPGAEGRGMGK